MKRNSRLTRRRALGTGAAMTGWTTWPLSGLAQVGTLVASPGASPVPTPMPVLSEVPLWQAAWEKGIFYGTSLATWQFDEDYLSVVEHEAAILITEDDLLWYRLRPTPESDLDFAWGDHFIALAGQQQQLVFGAYLVWDEGFGEGWTNDDLWFMDEATARSLLFDTLDAIVDRYKGRVAGWIVVNEVIVAHEADGLRTDYPWLEMIGPSVIAEAFRAAHAVDPDALLVLNEFGFETDSEWDRAVDKQERALVVLDGLLDAGAPVHAFGVQAHLQADGFAEKFDADGYRQFLSALAERGVEILITEMDVLDDGLLADIEVRDRVVADVYARYLGVALDEPAVTSLMTFGLTDRYTWLEEDYPRADSVPRRPLPFDEELRPKPAYDAIHTAFGEAISREPVWMPPRVK